MRNGQSPRPRRRAVRLVRVAHILGATATIGLVACSSSTGPPSPLLYSVRLYHGSFSHVTGPATSAVSGDTLSIYVDLTDSTTVGGTPATVRGTCAKNVTISRGSTVAATLPSPVTCPDSVYQLSIGPALSPTWISRGFFWIVPAALPSAVYDVRGETLVSPSLSVSVPLQIN